MEEMISVSVIIAVYNEENNISKCLDSLISQTLKDIQILCVNDASTDNSLEILNEYAAKDNRIEIINNKINARFVSKVRNKAIKYVKGQYLTLIDADDYVSNDYLERAYKIAIDTDAEIVVNKQVAWNEELVPLPREEDFKTASTITGKEALIASLDNWKIHSRCLMKFSLFDNYVFDEGRAYDCEYSTIYLYSICKTVSFADGIYYYCENKSSVTHQRDDRAFDVIYKQLKLRDLMKKNDVYKLFFHSFESQNLMLLKQFHYFYFKIRRQLAKEKKIIIKESLITFYNSFNINDILILETNKNPFATVLNKIRFSSYTLFYCISWILSKFVK